MPHDIIPNKETQDNVAIENHVEWEVAKPMTRLTLARVLEVCEEASIPSHAHLKIIAWNNREGFTVKATWPTVLHIES